MYSLGRQVVEKVLRTTCFLTFSLAAWTAVELQYCLSTFGTPGKHFTKPFSHPDAAPRTPLLPSFPLQGLRNPICRPFQMAALPLSLFLSLSHLAYARYVFCIGVAGSDVGGRHFISFYMSEMPRLRF